MKLHASVVSMKDALLRNVRGAPGPLWSTDIWATRPRDTTPPSVGLDSALSGQNAQGDRWFEGACEGRIRPGQTRLTGAPTWVVGIGGYVGTYFREELTFEEGGVVEDEGAAVELTVRLLRACQAAVEADVHRKSRP